VKPLAARVPALALLLALTASSAAQAASYRITAADRTEIERVLRAFFEATRDGNTAAASAHIPTAAEFRQIFARGAEPFIERHQRAIERDVRELRQRFAGGTWVGLSGPIARGGAVEMTTCGRLGAPQSRCIDGPVIDWRVGDRVEHLRIDRLVKLDGRWKIYDPRL
jgi:hypothetical protein